MLILALGLSLSLSAQARPNPAGQSANRAAQSPDRRTWHEAYAIGVKEFDAKNWQAAIASLERARQLNPKAGRHVSTTGSNFIDFYSPDYYLGIAYYNLKQYQKALQAFVRIDEKLISKTDKEYATLLDVMMKASQAANEPQCKAALALLWGGDPEKYSKTCASSDQPVEPQGGVDTATTANKPGAPTAAQNPPAGGGNVSNPPAGSTNPPAGGAANLPAYPPASTANPPAGTADPPTGAANPPDRGNTPPAAAANPPSGANPPPATPPTVGNTQPARGGRTNQPPRTQQTNSSAQRGRTGGAPAPPPSSVPSSGEDAGIVAFFSGRYDEARDFFAIRLTGPGYSPRDLFYSACSEAALVLTGRADPSTLGHARDQYAEAMKSYALDEDLKLVSPRILNLLQAK